jgi:hypothetical protein
MVLFLYKKLIEGRWLYDNGKNEVLVSHRVAYVAYVSCGWFSIHPNQQQA